MITYDREQLKKRVHEIIDDVIRAAIRTAINRAFGIEIDYDRFYINHNNELLDVTQHIKGAMKRIAKLYDLESMLNERTKKSLVAEIVRTYKSNYRYPESYEFTRKYNEMIHEHARARAWRDFEQALAQRKDYKRVGHSD